MTRRRNPEADITLADLAGHVAALEEKLDETPVTFREGRP